MTKDCLYVAAQLLLLALIVVVNTQWVFPQVLKVPGLILLVIGLVITVVAILQLRTSITPFPTPRPGGKLVTTGMYRWVRHPIYLGVVATALGYSAYAADGGKVVFVVLLYLLLHYKSAYEESMLDRQYAGYDAYRQRTGRILPGIG